MKVYTQAPDSFDVHSEDLSQRLPFFDGDSSEAIQIFKSTFSKPEFWQKLAEYQSQESSRSRENFNSQFAMFINVLSNQFEDLFVDVGIRPIVEKLLTDPAEKSKQRAGAEILAGLVRGSKHWSKSKMEKFWSWASPLIITGLQASTADSLRYWVDFLNSISVCVTIKQSNVGSNTIFFRKGQPRSTTYTTYHYSSIQL
jgi:hypothetical protein